MSFLSSSPDASWRSWATRTRSSSRLFSSTTTFSGFSQRSSPTSDPSMNEESSGFPLTTTSVNPPTTALTTLPTCARFDSSFSSSHLQKKLKIWLTAGIDHRPDSRRKREEAGHLLGRRARRLLPVAETIGRRLGDAEEEDSVTPLPSAAAVTLDLFSSSADVAASVPVSLYRVLHVDAHWTSILPCQQLGVDLTNFFKGWGRSRGFRRLG